MGASQEHEFERSREVGRLIQAARKERKLSQADVAAAIPNLSREWLSRIETGQTYVRGEIAPTRANPSLLAAIARIVGVEPREVLAIAGHDPNTVANIADAATIDVTGLSPNDIMAISQLVTSLKKKENPDAKAGRDDN